MAETPGALYFSHMRDGPLIRIRLPGGQVRAEQLRVIADLAQNAGNGQINLTNLGNFQVRGLNNIAVGELEAVLGAAGLLPSAPWADRLRNIICDPLAGFDGNELIDTSSFAQKLDEALQQSPVLKACSPKFSYLVDGGGRSNIAAVAHDVGLVAQKSGDDAYFRLFLAAKATRLCAAPDDAPHLAVAAARAALSFAAPGDGRYAGVLKRAGFCSPGVAAALARGVLALGGVWENRMRRLIPHIALADMEQRIAELAPGRFEMRDVTGAAEKKLKPSIGIIKQGKSGLDLCGFGVPLGRLDAGRLRVIAGLADEFGRGELRLSPWHVIFIPHVAKPEKLLASLRRHGFITGKLMLDVDISACSGRYGCRGAKLDTPGHALAVMRAFAAGKVQLSAPLSIHVSGCPKGCAHRGASDILALEREDGSGYYVYQNSAALAPEMKTRLQGTISIDELPQTALQLARRRGQAHLS